MRIDRSVFGGAGEQPGALTRKRLRLLNCVPCARRQRDAAFAPANILLKLAPADAADLHVSDCRVEA
jgi:hypothetical protein